MQSYGFFVTFAKSLLVLLRLQFAVLFNILLILSKILGLYLADYVSDKCESIKSITSITQKFTYDRFDRFDRFMPQTVNKVKMVIAKKWKNICKCQKFFVTLHAECVQAQK